MRYRLLALPLAVGAGLAVAAASAQEARTALGVLTCTSAAEKARDEGRLMTCGFKPTASGAEERYSGQLYVAGPNAQGQDAKRVWVWAVLGPSGTKIPGGLLAQRYVAVASPNKMAPPLLVGETNDTITLQAETTNEAAGTVTQIELKLLTTPA